MNQIRRSVSKKHWIETTLIRSERVGVVVIIAVLGAGCVYLGAQGGTIGILLVLLAPPAAILVLHRPAAGLVGLFLLLPWALAVPNSLAFRVVNYLLPALILGSWILHWLWKRHHANRMPLRLVLWFAVFIFWMVFTGFFAESPAGALVYAFRYLILAVVLLAITSLWSPAEYRLALGLYAAALFPLAIVGFKQAAEVGFGALLYARTVEPERLSSLLQNPNSFGLVMANGVVILVAWLLAPGTPRQTLKRGLIWSGVLFVILVLLTALVTSFSRASYLFLIVALGALICVHRPGRWLTLSGLVLVIAGLTLLPLPDWLSLGLRVRSGMSFRLDLWEAGWEIMRDHPWTGIGVGNEVFEASRAYYLDSEVSRALVKTQKGGAHNVFFNNGAMLGWFGLAMTVAFFLMVWREIPRAFRRYRGGDWVSGAAAAGILGFSVRAFFESTMTLGWGRITDSLIFFLFCLIVLQPKRSTGPPEP